MVGAVIFVQVLMNHIPGEESKFVEAFKQSEFVIKASQITATVDLGKQYINDNKKIAALKEFAKSLGLDEAYTIENNNSSSNKEVKLVKKSKSAISIIKIITNEKKVGVNVKEVQNFFVVDVTLFNDIDSVLYYKEKIEKLLYERNLSTDVIVNVYGEKDGIIADEDRKRIASNLMENIGGKSISEFDLGNAYNTYGYTSNIDKYIVQGGKKINIDVAITYNEEEDKSYLYLATPIITMEY
jgi:hypothetical protein